jgi:hypothetical protein
MHQHTGLSPDYRSITKCHKDIDTAVIQFITTRCENIWTIAQIVYHCKIKNLRSNYKLKTMYKRH